MGFLISLLIGMQVLCSLAGYPPQRESPPPPPPPPPDRLISPPCNSPLVKAAAELALEKLNEDRREGYVVGLQRIFDVHELQWRDTGVVYYFTLDVVETGCHVLSRKSWKDCQFRRGHELVYGQCKATFYINKPWRTLHLFNYDCVLRSLPAVTIARMCPDCPTPQDPTQPEYLEAAALSLAKFNTESNHTHYFKVRNVTRASYQWVVGPSHFVDYVIQETSCPKTQALDDLSKCSFLSDKTADVGVCTGSVIDSQIEHQKFITTKCEIFHPQVDGGQQTGNRKPGHHDDEESHEDDGHSKDGWRGHHSGDRRGGHHDGHSEDRREGDHDGHSEGGRGGHHGHHHHHPHDRRHHKHHGHHKNDSHDHADHGQNPPTSDTFETSAHLGKTVGRVTFLPLSNTHVSLHSLPDVERLDGAPVPPQSHEPKPVPNLPDIHGAPDESRPLGKPMRHPTLTKPVRPATPPPFPLEFSQSDTCPGEILVSIPDLDPLLPKRPVEPSPTGAAELQAQEKAKH